MSNPQHIRQLIMMGVLSLERIPSAEIRADLLDAAADVLSSPNLKDEKNDTLSRECHVTAACLRNAETAQLRLFDSIRPITTDH